MVGAGQNLEGVGLIQAEYDDEVLRSMLFRSLFYLFLLCKTCSSCRGSDKTGGVFIYYYAAGFFDACADRCGRNIIPFTEYYDFLPLQHLILLGSYLWGMLIGLVNFCTCEQLSSLLLVPHSCHLRIGLQYK